MERASAYVFFYQSERQYKQRLCTTLFRLAENALACLAYHSYAEPINSYSDYARNFKSSCVTKRGLFRIPLKI
jgi:hypothetical protein